MLSLILPHHFQLIWPSLHLFVCWRTWDNLNTVNFVDLYAFLFCYHIYQSTHWINCAARFCFGPRSDFPFHSIYLYYLTAHGAYTISMMKVIIFPLITFHKIQGENLWLVLFCVSYRWKIWLVCQVMFNWSKESQVSNFKEELIPHSST